jgi:hypothetical protein
MFVESEIVALNGISKLTEGEELTPFHRRADILSHSNTR